MKNKNQHTDRIIKRKIKKYEFEFSDHAWDKMEAMMDNPPPSTRSTHFFNLRNLLLMILLLVILTVSVFGTFSPGDQASTTQLSAFPIIEIPNAPLTATTDNHITALGPVFPASNDSLWANQQSVKAIDPLKLFPLGSSPFSLLPLAPVDHSSRDTSLARRLEQRIAEYNDHYAPEKVYLHLDRTFFKPGENIWFSAYLRDANTLKASSKSDILHVELLAPNGGVLKKLSLVSRKGQAKGDFTLPASAAGGMYKIKAYTNWQKNTGDAFERDLQVQKTVLPNLRMTAEFVRKAYGPGDRVEVDLELKTLENTVLANFPFEAVATVDGKALPEIKGKTLANGKAKIKFDLPKDLNSNDGLLNVMIEYNGQVESISRSIPIVLNKIDLQLLPEGGEMIAGIPAKVAFKAINEFGKPADIEGKVYNHNGIEVADFQSYHQGMGAFELTPEADEAYYAKITKPVGISGEYPLPFALGRGYALNAGVQKGKNLQVAVHSTENEPLTLVLQSHGEVYEVESTPAVKGTHHFNLPVDALPVGIASLTLFDSKEIARAERLVFLNPDKKLDIRIKTDKEQYLPREKVSMTIEVKDERGMPMPGKFSLSVADDNLLTFADDKQGGIMAYLLLESELKGKIEEPNFYFEPKDKHPEKDQLLALDYLMLTQGWRRLDWMELEDHEPVAMHFENEKAEIAGQVTNFRNTPIAEATVTIQGTKFTTSTDEQGRFSFANVEPENWPVQVLVSKEGRNRYMTVNDYQDDVKIVIAINPGHVFDLAKTESKQGNYIEGQVLDRETGEPMIGANVIFKGTNQGAVADVDGRFKIKNLQPGIYTLMTQYIGYKSFEQTIEIGKNDGLIATIGMGYDDIVLNEVAIVDYKVPLVEQDNTTSGAVITSEQIRKRSEKRQRTRSKLFKSKKAKDPAFPSRAIKELPTRDVDALAATAAGLSQEDEGDAVTIRGSRSDATDFFVDGIRVQGEGLDKRIRKEAEAQVNLTGTPAAAENKIADDKVAEPRNDELVEELAMVFDGVEVEEEPELIEQNLGFAAFKDAQRSTRYYRARTFYSPKYRSGEKVKARNDFRSTVYWNPDIRIDRKGKTKVEFYTTDALTTFRATIEGLATDGGIGAQAHYFHSQQPVGMKVKMPSMLLTGDEVTIPLTLSNNTKNTIEGYLEIFAPNGLKRIDQQKLNQRLSAKKTKTVYLRYKAEKAIANGQIAMAFNSENGFQDAFTQPVNVIARGFPVSEVHAGNTLEKTFTIHVDRSIEGTLNAVFSTYPSVLDDLVSGLDRMLRQPGGCFEQTSSSNYPNLLVMDYLRSTNTIDREVEKRAMDFLKYGYNRLLTFEIQGGGFDWFGSPPAHEALSAYGLMEFVDMKEVYPVDSDLIERTAKWLLSRKDGNGGWQNSKRGAHRWEAKNPVADAYITWALVESGYGKEIKAEIDKSCNDALQTEDPYILALVANTLLKVNDKRAENLMKKLMTMQAEDGSWNGLTFSMTHSTGHSLKVETTALATLAVLKFDKSSPGLSKAINFIASAKNQYGFGSTQSTVLAMKALVEYAKHFESNEEGGTLIVHINGQKAINRKYAKGEQLTFDDLARYFKDGENEVNVKFKNTKEAVPYDLSIDYSTVQPNNDEECKVAIETELKRSSADMGNTVRLRTSLKNRSGEVVLNPIAKVGIPAGLSAQPWQLKELQEKGVYDFYEITDGYVVFYFRGMQANAIKTIDLDLKADVPGTYEAPASLAYLYYTNEYQHWSKPGRLVINE